MPTSPNESALTGLNLLRLLVQNRVAEFHTELEEIPAEVGFMRVSNVCPSCHLLLRRPAGIKWRSAFSMASLHAIYSHHCADALCGSTLARCCRCSRQAWRTAASAAFQRVQP